MPCDSRRFSGGELPSIRSSRPECVCCGAPQARAKSLRLRRAPTVGARRLNGGVRKHVDAELLAVGHTYYRLTFADRDLTLIADDYDLARAGFNRVLHALHAPSGR